MSALTAAEKKFVNFVRELLSKSDQIPTQKEIARQLGVNTSYITRLIKKCVDKGALVHEKHVWHSLSLPKGGPTT